MHPIAHQENLSIKLPVPWSNLELRLHTLGGTYFPWEQSVDDNPGKRKCLARLVLYPGRRTRFPLMERHHDLRSLTGSWGFCPNLYVVISVYLTTPVSCYFFACLY